MKNFDYTLKRRKGVRSLRLAVHGDGVVVVTAPRGLTKGMIEKFVTEKSEWILDKIRLVRTRPKKILDTRSKQEYEASRGKALELVKDRLEHFRAFYGYSYTKVSIRNQRTRWGSCSKQGALSFHYKIAFLPEHLADYIIVHEVCHLKEMNHSKKFWDLVARALPDHRARRKELRAL